jgi:formylglycine-generating enzyme
LTYSRKTDAPKDLDLPVKLHGMKALRLFCMLSVFFPVLAMSAGPMQAISNFEIDRTEVSIGEFRRFIEVTRLTTQAEKTGGGQTYEGGWVRRKGWGWALAAPFGQRASDAEPAVHVTYPEAAAYCRWAGKRLPTDAEWMEAADTAVAYIGFRCARNRV